MQDYDEHGEYIKTWVPELRNVSTKRIHEPWLMSQAEMQQFGVVIGQDYPAPVTSSQMGRPHGSKRPSLLLCCMSGGFHLCVCMCEAGCCVCMCKADQAHSSLLLECHPNNT